MTQFLINGPFSPSFSRTMMSDASPVTGARSKNGASSLQFDTVEDTIEAFKRGDFIIVLDGTDRENEGDLIIAAEDITTEKMAFMIRHTSGLVCAPVSGTLTTSLLLPQMVPGKTDLETCAYTVSIDASDPVITTGISVQDRAFTCRALAAKQSRPESFRRPGHVFPLRARDGGVRERRGHTEATIEFCKLAGKAPAGVLCEVVDDGDEVEGKAVRRDGGMMRRDGCLKFGKRWGIKVCTIEDLLLYLDGQRKEGRRTNGHG